MKVLFIYVLMFLFSFSYSQNQNVKLSYMVNPTEIDSVSIYQVESEIINIKYSINEFKKNFVSGSSLLLTGFVLKSIALLSLVLPDYISPVSSQSPVIPILGVSAFALDFLGLIYYSVSFSKFISTKYTPRQLIILSNSLNNEGTILLNDGSTSKANKHFKKAIKLNPLNVHAINNHGCVKLRYTNYKGAIKVFDKALSINQSHKEIYFNKGIAYMESHNIQEACSCWEAAQKLGCDKSADYFRRLCK